MLKYMSDRRDKLPRPFSRRCKQYPVFFTGSSAPCATDLVSEWIDTLCGGIGGDLEGG